MKPTIDGAQRRAIAQRHGQPLAVALTDLLKQPVSDSVESNQLEALQLAEIASRLRLQVRDLIREYRRLEQHWHLLHTELEHVHSEMREHKARICRPGFGQVQGTYALYKVVWRDFLYALDWATRLQDLNGPEREEFETVLRNRSRQQARQLHRAEKASQLAAALLTESEGSHHARCTAL